MSSPHVVFRIRVAARRRRRLVPTRRRRHVPTRTAGVPFVVPSDGFRHVRAVWIVMVRRRVTVRWMVRRRMVRRRMVRRRMVRVVVRRHVHVRHVGRRRLLQTRMLQHLLPHLFASSLRLRIHAEKTSSIRLRLRRPRRSRPRARRSRRLRGREGQDDIQQSRLSSLDVHHRHLHVIVLIPEHLIQLHHATSDALIARERVRVPNPKVHLAFAAVNGKRKPLVPRRRRASVSAHLGSKLRVFTALEHHVRVLFPERLRVRESDRAQDWMRA